MNHEFEKDSDSLKILTHCAKISVGEYLWQKGKLPKYKTDNRKSEKYEGRWC